MEKSFKLSFELSIKFRLFLKKGLIHKNPCKTSGKLLLSKLLMFHALNHKNLSVVMSIFSAFSCEFWEIKWLKVDRCTRAQTFHLSNPQPDLRQSRRFWENRMDNLKLWPTGDFLCIFFLNLNWVQDPLLSWKTTKFQISQSKCQTWIRFGLQIFIHGY